MMQDKAFWGRLLPLLITMAMLCACSALPTIKPVDPAHISETIKSCRYPFADVPYRFVHAVEVILPGAGRTTVLGVTVFEPHSARIRSVIMTIEGFVLFDARHDKDASVLRAAPPFDSDQFAARMMEDVRLIFLAPEGRLLQAGRRDDGTSVCRYSEGQHKITDVSVHPDGAWEIAGYDENKTLRRRVSAVPPHGQAPAFMELQSFGFSEYTLRMSLISAEPVDFEEAWSGSR